MFRTEAKDNYRQFYYEGLDSVISGLSIRFEPDATAVHLAHIENFLVDKHKDSDYIARAYKVVVNGPQLTFIEIYSLTEQCQQEQPLESFDDVVELLKRKEVFRELVPELTILVKIMLMLPASICTAERSFSGVKRLKIYLRLEITQQ